MPTKLWDRHEVFHTAANRRFVLDFFVFKFPLNFPSNRQPNPRMWRWFLGTWRSTGMASKSVAERSYRSALWSAPLTASPWTLTVIIQSFTKTSKWPLGRSSEDWMMWTRRLLSSGTFRRLEFLEGKLFGIFWWTFFDFACGLRYDGYSTWRADICTIIIKGFFKYQPHILPACLEFVKNSTERYPSTSSMALVAGWGLTEVSNVLIFW